VNQESPVTISDLTGECQRSSRQLLYSAEKLGFCVFEIEVINTPPINHRITVLDYSEERVNAVIKTPFHLFSILR
jgi:hypothetical protein